MVLLEHGRELNYALVYEDGGKVDRVNILVFWKSSTLLVKMCVFTTKLIIYQFGWEEHRKKWIKFEFVDFRV